jgi:hypothetical protein
MKSGGQMSSQSPVVWWYREVFLEFSTECQLDTRSKTRNATF